MRTFLQDLRYALRVLLKSRGFTAAAVSCLALGVGANTAVFSVVNAVLIRPLPYPAPDRLAAVYETNPKRGWTGAAVCPADFLDWREQLQSFEALAAYQLWNPNLTAVEEPERLEGLRASGDLFRLLGVEPMAGRVFLREDEDRQARVVVVSHGFWQRRFGGDPKLIGQSLLLDGESYQVVGIMPPRFQFPSREIELWKPLALDARRNERGEHELTVIARLKTEVSAGQARAELVTLMSRIDAQFHNSGCGADFVALREWYVGGSARRNLWTLAGAVGLVLLIACANVANLLLAHSSTRLQELAIKSALGATRRRLIGQLLTESVFLVFLGGGLGLILSLWGRDLLVALLPASTVAYSGPIEVDGRVLAYTLALSILSGLIFGLAPAFHASRAKLNLNQATARIAPARLSGALLTVETALAVILLAGTGLLIRSFLRVYHVDPGFSVDSVLTTRVNLPARRYAAGQQVSAFYEQVLNRLASSSRVRAAGAVTNLPFGGGGNSGYISFEDRPAPPGSDPSGAERLIVTPGYFQALRIPLHEGRLFTDQDGAGATPVVLVNQTMARLHWPGENPIGRRIKRGTLTAPFPWMTVIGVVADVKQHGPTTNINPTIYLPFLQTPVPGMTLVVRTDSDPVSLVSELRSAVRAVDADQPLAFIRTLEDVHWSLLASRRTAAFSMGVFAGLALVLAVVGTYGVVSHAVARRTREFGIRVALGAGQGDVLRMAVRQGMIPVLVGIVIGLAAAAALTGLIEQLLWSTSPTDALAFVVAAVLLALAALAASYVPARRAIRLDPVSALRCE